MVLVTVPGTNACKKEPIIWNKPIDILVTFAQFATENSTSASDGTMSRDTKISPDFVKSLEANSPSLRDMRKTRVLIKIGIKKDTMISKLLKTNWVAHPNALAMAFALTSILMRRRNRTITARLVLKACFHQEATPQEPEVPLLLKKM